MHAQGNDSGPGFHEFPAGTRGKAPENGRKVEAVKR